MFEASSVYFQCVNEWAAHVKTVFPVGVGMGHSKSVISLAILCLSTTGVLWMKIKRPWEYKDDFLVFLWNFRPFKGGPSDLGTKISQKY